MIIYNTKKGRLSLNAIEFTRDMIPMSESKFDVIDEVIRSRLPRTADGDIDYDALGVLVNKLIVENVNSDPMTLLTSDEVMPLIMAIIKKVKEVNESKLETPLMKMAVGVLKNTDIPVKLMTFLTGVKNG